MSTQGLPAGGGPVLRPPEAGPDAEASAEAAAQEQRARFPANELILAALTSDDNLDFPKVTEICERLEVLPAELRDAIKILVTALADAGGAHPRVKLRALTISNELMYNERAVAAFRRARGLPEALARLKTVQGSELGAVSDANARMLATEIDRICFPADSEVGVAQTTSGPTTAMARAATAAEHLGLQPGTVEDNMERLSRARQKAKRALVSFGKKAEKTMIEADKAMQKAERAFERSADAMLSQAGWGDLAGVTAHPSSPSGQPSAAAAAAAAAPRGGPGGNLELSIDQVSQQLAAAERRAAAAEAALAARASAEAAEVSDVVQQLESSEVLLAGLLQPVSDVEADVARLGVRCRELEAEIACVKDSPRVARFLLAHLADLERTVAPA